MAKKVKKAIVQAVKPKTFSSLVGSVETTVEDVERVLEVFRDFVKTRHYWIIIPEYVPRVTRATMQAKIRGMRIKLAHREWADCRDAAKELSDTGGVLSVRIVKLGAQITESYPRWIDGKEQR